MTAIPTRAALRGCVCAAVIVISSCSKESPPAAAPAAEAPRPLVDPCALLTREEVSEVQGSGVEDVKASKRSAPDVAVSQCYFQLPSNADSINVIVTQRIDSASPRDPRAVWHSMFLEPRPPKVGHDGREKVQPHPEKIGGIGEDAYWTGGRFGGTLNVLQGDVMVQISVGGPGDEAKKLDQLKQLAVKAVARL